MNWLTHSWYQPHPIRWLLFPLSLVYLLVICCRQWLYRHGIFKQYRLNVPVIIVGNITVGGTGKTPFVIWLAKQLKQMGYQPGIISRGYGGQSASYPVSVSAISDPAIVGDEPVLISRHTDCPLVVDPDRVNAAKFLLSQHACDLIISDDGLQHYRLNRDIECVIFDGARQLGNQLLLPAGPLREPKSRLDNIDFLITNTAEASPNITMQLKQGDAINLANTAIKKPLAEFTSSPIHAIAGIGNPKRFFDDISRYHLSIIKHEFIDHHSYTANDLEFDDDYPILMTEKDAVKCQSFASDNMWYIPIEAVIDETLIQQIELKLTGIESNGKIIT
jgi:tetraacyldisaccharide 4'-kinase